MPNLNLSINNQQRRVESRHINKLDDNVGGAKLQKERIANIASCPGASSDNIQRQLTLLAIVHLLSFTGNRDKVLATTPKNAEAMNVQNRMTTCFENFKHDEIVLRVARAIQGYGKEEQPLNRKTPVGSHSSLNEKSMGVSSGDIPESAASFPLRDNVGHVLNSIANTLFTDRLKFPGAEALPLQGDNNIAHPVLPESKVEYNILASEVINQANQDINQLLQAENRWDSGDISKEELLCAVADSLYQVNTVRGIDNANGKEAIAKKILAAGQLYGGLDDEKITTDQVESVLCHWVFDNILNMSPAEYLAKGIAQDTSAAFPSEETIKEATRALSLIKLDENKQINLSKVPGDKRESLEAMWQSCLEKEMPFLLADLSLVNNLQLSDFRFASFYTGAMFLAELGSNRYTAEEAMSVGDKMWESAIEDGITESELDYFLAPAQFFMANHLSEQTPLSQGTFSKKLAVVNDYLEYRKQVERVRQDIDLKYQNYQSAVTTWLSKGQLADKIIDQCPTSELPRKIVGFKDSIGVLESREKGAERAKQRYLDDRGKPCELAPNNLNDEYNKLSVNVADSYRELDKYLVSAAIETLPKDEYNFISAPDANMYLGKFSMSTNRRGAVAKGVYYEHNIDISLLKTDLIVVKKGSEERIYALQGIHSDNEAYKIFRVDRDITSYIYSGILDYQNFGKILSFTDNKIDSDRDDFTYKISTDREIALIGENKISALVNSLCNIHQESLYDGLYQSGNTQSDNQKVWNIVKHVIPFYDCVEGIINDDPVQAVPACLLDAMSLIPVFGEITSLTGKFGMSATRGLQKGIASSIAKNSLKTVTKNVLSEVTLPTTSELASLGKATLRTLDPGIELVYRGGQKFGHTILARLTADAKTQKLGRKLVASGVVNNLPDTPFTSSNMPKMAALKDSKIQIAIKEIDEVNGQKIYVRINPETNELFGKRYTLNDKNYLTEAPHQWFTLKERLDNLKREGLSGKGANGAVKVWTDEELNITPNLRVLEDNISNAISTKALKKIGGQIETVKGMLYRLNGQHYIKYKSKFFPANIDSTSTPPRATIFTQQQNKPSGSKGSDNQTGSSQVQIMECEFVDGEIKRILLSPGSIEEKIFNEASNALGDAGILIPIQQKGFLDASLVQGIPVANAMDIIPINGLRRVFVKKGTQDYYIRHKDNYFRVKSTSEESKVYIYGETAVKPIASIKKAHFVSYDAIIPNNIRKHIVQGDSQGGGHLYPGLPGKSSFPESWDADKIIDDIGGIVLSPQTKWFSDTNGIVTPAGMNARWIAVEIRDGVNIKVIYEPKSNIVITGFPVSVNRMPNTYKQIDKSTKRWI
ncbi:EndoU domain-containing protein [Providencia rettgeri]|nr:EndoU domain-containing protein [Providencia rettgeri]